eukprot:CAMPEP_0204586626 /NCGR_PEP_ID=MMETSP0661-20131031/47602_1 /ASSEMBLY_ACC=CAM_ASM_000606 /TAXON_ID=109239 /ORGANISM="Alexandrium margalefi, Strain AMGDE01CS-322" /LENGTH=129 /DNA_ID=CAMNT_0051596279 /DNA_START=85 /DNA_END=471 /DNA_ORIENTATION=+
MHSRHAPTPTHMAGCVPGSSAAWNSKGQLWIWTQKSLASAAREKLTHACPRLWLDCLLGLSCGDRETWSYLSLNPRWSIARMMSAKDTSGASPNTITAVEVLPLSTIRAPCRPCNAPALLHRSGGDGAE